MMAWRLSHAADSEVVPMADRHYSRKTPGAPQFSPPGRKLILKTVGAYWVTSWPFAEYVKHAWAGAWVNAAFRREPECGYLATELIRQAVAATRWKYGDPPELGMVTMIDTAKVRPTRVRGGVNVWGWTYLKVGFRAVGHTKGGLLVLQLLPAAMPPPAEPLPAGSLAQRSLFEVAA